MTTRTTLTAKRITLTEGEWKGARVTHFHSPDGRLKAVFPAYVRQPRKDKKTIVINCWRYAVKWT